MTTITTLTDVRGTVREIARRDGAPHEVRVEFHEGNESTFLAVHFGLNYLRGNSQPYFSLTCDGRTVRNGRLAEEFGGADHDLILRELPELADLAALHLAGIDGAPLHAEANGWYQLAGACGGFNERYHAGNAETYGRPRDPLGSFAKHCRVTREEAAAIAKDVVEYDVAAREGVAWKDRVSGVEGRKRWREICASFAPRWKREADAAIEKYGLTVFGDHWRRAS